MEDKKQLKEHVNCFRKNNNRVLNMSSYFRENNNRVLYAAEFVNNTLLKKLKRTGYKKTKQFYVCIQMMKYELLETENDEI